MDFLKSTLADEYRLISESRQPKYYTYSAVFVTENGEVDVMKVVSVEWKRDYQKAAMDTIMVEMAMQWGDYNTLIVPFKENLRLTLTRTPITATGQPIIDEIIEATFDASIMLESEESTLAARPDLVNREVSNLVGIRKVTVQLQTVAGAILRTEMVGGSFRNSRPFDVLMSIVQSSINALDVEDEYRVSGIVATAPDNNASRNNIIIPHGTPLIQVADKLQSQFGGIYNTGIGFYLQRDVFYIWSLYNTKRFDTANKTASFIIAPGKRFMGVDKTYRLVDEHLTVFVTGGVNRIDGSEVRLLNEGNGVRFADPASLMDGFVETGGNKAIAKRSNNVNEYTGVRRRGASMSRVNENLSQTNAFHEASKLVERSTAYIVMVWENCDHDLLTPGLQCEVIYLENNVPRTINGTVIHVHAYASQVGQGPQQTLMQQSAEVIVAVDRLTPTYQMFMDDVG